MQTIELTIQDVAYGGRGLGRLDGRVVFVPGVIPGERARARIAKQRKNYAEARLVEILEPSPRRARPVCPLAGTCPGCAYQHMAYAEELRLKAAQLADFLRYQVDASQPDTLLPPVASPRDMGYRNKIVLHASVNGNRTLLGYKAEDNRAVLDVPLCHLAMAPINRRLAERRADPRFMSSLKPGMSVTFRHTENDGALMWKDRTGPGKERLTEFTVLGPLRAPQRSFFQVNPAVGDALIERVMALVKERQPETVIDLYCGVGLFALAADRAGAARVIGIDSDSEAIHAAVSNAERLAARNAEFRACQACLGLKDALGRFGGERTLLIVDPPRRGLEREVVDRIAAANVSLIAHVSCAPDTLARDVARLAEAGWRVASAQVFDMFPRAASFESITVLEK
ncbi:MAG: TRAM domain-containing protein [Verrucomicrobiota bacterium]|nr:TRAM domain-containing protein [Verrucomicrobiota bacterium]